MRIFDIIAMGSRNLARRKMRTFLTVIGVVVGSAAIVVMVSLVVGMNISLEETIASMGDLTVIQINTFNSHQNADGEWEHTENELTDELFQQIKQMDGVEAATPLLVCWQYDFRFYAGRRYRTNYSNLYGVYPEALEYMGITLDRGEMPEAGDTDFVIFGPDTVYNFRDPNKKIRNWYKEYYNSDGTRKPPKVDVLTENIYVQAYSYQYQSVVGPGGMISVGDSSSSGQDRNSRMTKHYFTKVGVTSEENESDYRWYDFIHIDTMRDMILEQEKAAKVKESESQAYNYEAIFIKAKDMASADAIQAELKEMGLSINSLSDTRKAMQENQAAIQYVLGGVGAMSLFVAAIGIANTMIMSIYERTREIGMMKAIGCPISSIKFMFLYEAAMIGFIGGVLGIGLSYGLSYAFNNIESLSTALGVSGGAATTSQLSVIPFWLVILAIIFSTLIGLISGYIPAVRATKISALEAIKSDS